MSFAYSRRERRVLRPLQDYLRTEAGAGLLLLAMVPIALVWANGSYADSYERLWSTGASVSFAGHGLNLDLRGWVNDALMMVFFFVVGLEIKREVVDGELHDPQKAVVPVVAALGGMAMPALLFTAFNAGGDGAGGWGIPMATDIAIVLGFLALLGSRVPPALKTFLLTSAIVDDVAAIIVIALFYGHGVHFAPLAICVALLFAYWLLGRSNVRWPVLALALAVASWIAMHDSGVHATLAGVALALLTPSRPVIDRDFVDAEQLADVSDKDAVAETVSVARDTVSSVEWLQHLFHPWSSYLVLPLFALANAGIVVSSDTLHEALASPVPIGIVVGLLVGKPLGISLFTLLALRVLHAKLPEDVTLKLVFAGSLLAAIGFTVSLFISDLAFVDESLVAQAKAGVLAASFVAGVVGYSALRVALRRNVG